MILRLLWAVSSVGLGHVMRDLSIVHQLQNRANIDVHWLAPAPVGKFLRHKGHTILTQSEKLEGSGRLYDRIFTDGTREFNLMTYTRADGRLHGHDFKLSAQAWKDTAYDLVVGDEAFWLLTGFASKWAPKPAPFVFLTDFIGVKAMRPHLLETLVAWQNNLRFTFSHLGPTVYVYIGAPEEIPNERFGFLLPNRRQWAQRHCRFVKPIVGFAPEFRSSRASLRARLKLPLESKVFLATVGPHGNRRERVLHLESVFELLKVRYPDACFILVGVEDQRKTWIQYHAYLDRLYEYFAVADFVLIQSGYGKVTELLALGVPFIAIPLDFHFEQEWVMAHRLRHYGGGELMTLREHPPEAFAAKIQALIHRRFPPIPVDNGAEVADLILQTAPPQTE